MPKTLKVISIVLFFISLLPIAFSQAQTTDSIRFVTYYPSPYGSYRELRAKRIAIGDDYIKGGTIPDGHDWKEYDADPFRSIGFDADLVVQGNVGIGTANPRGSLEIQQLPGVNSGGIIIGPRNLVYPQSYLDIHTLVAGQGDGNIHLGYQEQDGTLSNYLRGAQTIVDGLFQAVANVAKTTAARTDVAQFSSIDAINKLQLVIQTLGDPTAGNRKTLIQSVEQNVANRDLLLNPDGGNVGIGTTNPQAKLHIGGTAGTDGIMFPDGTLQKTAADSTPAYDSGWFYADTSYNNTITLNHNLNYIPTRIQMYAANSDNPTWVRPVPLQSQGNPYWAPESFWLSNTQALVILAFPDSIIFCDVNNPCPSGVSPSNKGYLRVLMWK